MSDAPSVKIANPAKHKFLQRRQYRRIKFIENIEIKIAWIVKKSINLNDGHVNVLGYKKKNKINFTKGKKNVFEIKNGIKCSFKHWALILELSNGSFVNI